MRKINTSLIITVFNEQDTILSFIKSIFNQSQLPDEFIVVDGGSTDKTVHKINDYRLKIEKPKIKFKLIIKKGNRSVGRNEAIKNASGEIILSSDAGCILDRDWVRNITKPFKNQSVDVVSGYYKGKSKNVFQKCLIPYVLVMPDKTDASDFLPATRSMAFRKKIWEKAGGFNEKYSHNEDYVFAQKLKKVDARIEFARDAIVNWIPRKNLKGAFIMFFRFAYGDSESGIVRNKVLLIFARYFFFLYFISIFLLIKSLAIILITLLFSFFYILWSINKNYRYVKHKKALIFLPILQITSDVAVLTGTCLGFIRKITKINCKMIFSKNLIFIAILAIYIITMISVISSGIPSIDHPFPYHMDEWHQMQAVRNVFKYGSPNVEGSANGTMFHFFITGMLLAPFHILGLINPFAIKSAIDSLPDQERFFIVLRLTTLLFGILTIIILPKISKLLKLNSLPVVALFIFTPAWLVLSNFFKYDIALTFWIVLSLLYFIKYSINSETKNFLLACFFSGVAFAVKVSAIPLLLVIPLAYFLFTPSFNKKYHYLFLGIFTFLLNAIFLGMPDIVFGGRNMNVYLYENIIQSLQIVQNYNLGESLLGLTILKKFPAIFGHPLYIFFLLSIFYVFFLVYRDFKKRNFRELKIKLFILLSFFIFAISFILLAITVSANRSIVLLPFIVIIVALALKSIFQLIKHNLLLKLAVAALLIGAFVVQIIESYLWIRMKIIPSPQEISSDWVLKNIKSNSNIGLENIPIYQFEPDFILKDFYNKQYYPKFRTKYNYSIIDKNTKIFPEYIVLSNVEFEHKYLRTSPKNKLVERLNRKGYKRIAYFPLALPLYEYFDKKFYYPYLGLFTYPDGISIYEKN